YHLLLSCLILISNAPSPPDIYPLSLHDALPICSSGDSSVKVRPSPPRGAVPNKIRRWTRSGWSKASCCAIIPPREKPTTLILFRSEEHTSELQSRSDLVCRLLLEKKKKNAHADV